MATKTITALVDGVVQQIEVEDMTSEQQITIEDRLIELEDKPIIADGNMLVGNGTEDLVEITPEDVLSHINGASVMTMTSNEFENLESTNANTLYMLTDTDNYIDADTLDGLHASDFMLRSNKKEVTITLPAANWVDNTQTISVQDVTETNSIIVSSRNSSTPEYTSRGVYCSEQLNGQLVFTCQSIPNEDLEVNILILS